MFNHPDIQKYQISDIPLNEDIYLMDEKWLPEYEKTLVKIASGENLEVFNIGYISHAAARSVDEHGVELSWYPNINDRFHEVRIRLSHNDFVVCVGYWQGDIRPRIFVRGAWHDGLYSRNHSAFAMIDAGDFKLALAKGTVSHTNLTELRDRIDKIASQHQTIAFVSFADSLLLKNNWTVGAYDSPIKNTYQPETILHLIPEIKKAYQEILGVPIYATMAQGIDEYYADQLMHISKEQNHFSLNSLGLPFAQVASIEHAARRAVKVLSHGRAELYLDKNFLYSLKLKYTFDKSALPRYPYSSPMTNSEGQYIATNLDMILKNLE